MNRLSALALTAKVQAAWDESWSQAKVDQWVDTLAGLNEVASEAALARLRSGRQTSPTMHEFETIARSAEPPAPRRPDGYNRQAGAAAAAKFVAVKGSGVRPLRDVAAECFAAAEAYRDVSHPPEGLF